MIGYPKLADSQLETQPEASRCLVAACYLAAAALSPRPAAEHGSLDIISCTRRALRALAGTATEAAVVAADALSGFLASIGAPSLALHHAVTPCKLHGV